jgi:hypothetical protein
LFLGNSEKNGAIRLNATYHKLCSGDALGEALLDEGVGEDNFCELDSEVILIARAVLLDRRSDADRGDGYVLPDILLREAMRWF